MEVEVQHRQAQKIGKKKNISKGKKYGNFFIIVGFCNLVAFVNL